MERRRGATYRGPSSRPSSSADDAQPYAPKKVLYLVTEGTHKGAYGVRIPELLDIADTAFTNNHCLRYAGRALIGTDSVIRIESEPVPWLDGEHDLYGTLYLKVDGYQMVGSLRDSIDCGRGDTPPIPLGRRGTGLVGARAPSHDLAMRHWLAVVFFAFLGAEAAAQTATVMGNVVLKEGGQPLGFTTVSVPSQGMHLLTNETGRFVLLHLPPGEVRIRLKRIGFAPRDTVFTLAANDTARLTVEMTRLVIQLPTMLVSGTCTDRTPSEAQPAVLAELFDQVNQNAERARLLAAQKPFLLHVYRMQAVRSRGRIVPTRVDTIVQTPLARPYVPTQVIRRGDGVDAGDWVFSLPDLANFADTAFVNNHCFRYAGQGRWESDSVIMVDYEPVPWLDKEVDIKGTLYLRARDYQLVGTTTTLNRIPPQFWRSGLEDVTVRARFGEIIGGVPTLDEWEMTRRFRPPQATRIERGQVFRLQWVDSTAGRPDTVGRANKPTSSAPRAPAPARRGHRAARAP